MARYSPQTICPQRLKIGAHASYVCRADHFQLRYLTYNEAQGTNFQSPKEIKEQKKKERKIKLQLKIHFSQQSSPISINEYLENSSVANYRFFAE